LRSRAIILTASGAFMRSISSGFILTVGAAIDGGLVARAARLAGELFRYAMCVSSTTRFHAMPRLSSTPIHPEGPTYCGL
jgi:hypothetical protein